MEDYLDGLLDESNSEMGDSVDPQEAETSSIDGQADEQPKGQSLEDQLDGVEVEGEGNLEDILSQINGMGLLRNGLPVEYQNIDDVKEHLQKGYDYTAKTQELAEQRKQFETELSEQKQALETEREEFSAQRQELESTVMENQILAEILTDLQAREPEVFAEIQQAFIQRQNLYQNSINNPHVKALESKYEQLQKQIGESSKAQEEAKKAEIRNGWETELTQVQTSYAPKLRKLGVKPNWQEVQSLWQADASGKMSVKSALLAVHGEEIQKALEAQAKVNATKAKSAQRMGPTGEGAGITPKDNDDYLSAAMRIAREI